LLLLFTKKGRNNVVKVITVTGAQ